MVHLVTAIIKPHKLEEVKEAVRGLGIQGLTVSEVQGYGRQGGKSETFRGSEYNLEFVPKVKVELLVDSGIVDKVATAIWVDDTCFYVNFYRIAAQGCFTSAQLDCLQTIAPAIGASVARHFQQSMASAPEQNLAALFATRAPLADLTRREQEVCRRILLGFSSEAISHELGISLHSTLTYRKRAYDRLGISSQNELFAIVLRLLAGPARPELTACPNRWGQTSRPDGVSFGSEGNRSQP